MTETSTILLPDLPALVVGANNAAFATGDGEIDTLSLDEAADMLARKQCLVCHLPFMSQRVKLPHALPFDQHLDVLELYAFVKPAQFCLPTPKGLARDLNLGDPATLEDQAMAILQAAQVLLTALTNYTPDQVKAAQPIAANMARAGWPWGAGVIAALGGPGAKQSQSFFDVARKLTEWEDDPQEGVPGTTPVAPDAARARLAALTGTGAEPRPAQMDYTSEVTDAFAPPSQPGAPRVVLAEAGTGIGKTLGYIAPASLWAEQNGPGVWLSTFTKNLQRQIDQELDKLYPDPAVKSQKAVVRKGRENYLCLLNFEETAGQAGGGARAVALGLVARWIQHTRDGDMVGGDFPNWLRLTGLSASNTLTDRRGECIYAACQHYRKCFVERAIRKSNHADLIVANHALVMHQAAVDAALTPPAKADGTTEDSAHATPHVQYVFDEGHHVFDAADSAFSAILSGVEGSELRRWIRGPEGRGARRSRGRGLQERFADLLPDDEKARKALDEALKAAAALPMPGSAARIAEGMPSNPAERFLAAVRQQVLARNEDTPHAYGLETPCEPVIEGLLDAAQDLVKALEEIQKPLLQMIRLLRKVLNDDTDTLETPTRVRIEAGIRSLERRARLTLPAWIDMLMSLSKETPPEFVDWFSLTRFDGREVDIAMHRHWVDPSFPFARSVLENARGALITSATLRDQVTEDDNADASWETAEIRTGGAHLIDPPKRLRLASPFDYAKNTRILIVRDVKRTDPVAIAAAYRELFLAAGGGALGLFTAIARLRGVYDKVAEDLEAAGLPLFAQHVDAMDVGTLVDIFKAEEDACLLGTDAVRDGVDVPGRSLRLIVFDRVPWPRPDILHKARRAKFGQRTYDDMLTRLKLKQAYGRLIRRADDRGVFVMLDPMMPTRLTTAFPEGVEVERVGIAEAVAAVREFLSVPPNA